MAGACVWPPSIAIAALVLGDPESVHVVCFTAAAHEGFLAVSDALCEWAESAELPADHVLPARLQSNKSAE